MFGVETAFGFILRTSPAAIGAVNPVVKRSQLRKSKERKIRKVCYTISFQHDFSAPVTGITPSTQVGRLSGSHFDIGFRLTQFPVEKEWRNGKVKSPIN